MCDSSDSPSTDQLKSKSIAFSFTKKVKQNSISLNNKLNTDLRAKGIDEDKDFVTSIDDNHIHSTAPKHQKKDLVIPLIVNNRYNYKQKSDSQKETTDEVVDNTDTIEPKVEETLEEKARRELLKEANELIDGTKDEKKKSSRVIPVVESWIQNKVPEGFETNDNFDVSLRPVEPTVDDYQSVPVEEFGLAMLRGMGWKPGMGVGANASESYVPIEPIIRPKGLGLGAEVSLPKQIHNKSKDLKEEDLQPKKGSSVCVEFGAYKGSYGVIEDFDDEMSRVTIKLTLKKESIRIPIALVRVVSKTEFQNEGKVINKKQYEEYQQKQEIGDKYKESREKDRKSKSHRSEPIGDNHHKKHSSHKTWLLPNLKVKIIDKKYKNGKYYKEKVIIIDVLSHEKCCCKTSDGRLLDDIDYHMLETVVPRDSETEVMILEGKYRKELAVIVDRNRDRNEANVQLLSDKRQIIPLSYDQICEFVQ